LNVIKDIKHLYKPIQPHVRHTAENVSYVEFLPHTELQDVVYCYWQLKTTHPLIEPFIYRVVADGCMDIFFEINIPHHNFIMGFCKQYTEFPLEHSFNYVGVRFLPTMFPQLIKIDASELSNRFEHLNTIDPTTSTFIAQHFHPKKTIEEIKALFDTYFLDLLSKSNFIYDVRLYKAIDIILKNHGVLNIEKDLDTGISPRQLRRLFEIYIGETAKTFSKVVRFQNVLKSNPSSQGLRQTKLFFESGYYDQSHFIKEFKTYYGLKPSKALGI